MMKIEKDEIDKIKKELKSIFSSFINDPDNEEIQNNAIKIYKKYSGLLSYAEHSSDKLVPEHILNAIGNVSRLYEYGLYEDNHPEFSKEKILEKAKSVLKSLE
jgi:hypothetical protein